MTTAAKDTNDLEHEDSDSDDCPADLENPHVPSSPTIDARSARITSGPVRSTITWLALPVLGEQLLNSVISFYDVYLAGNLGEGAVDSVTATSAVGLAAYVGWLAGMVVMFVGAGTSALVSRAWGARRKQAASVVMNRSLAMAALSGATFSALLAWLAPYWVDFVGLGPEVRPASIRYLRLDAIGHPAMAISLIGAASLRGSGDMKTPLMILIVVNFLNAAVSTWLAYGGPGGPWGLDGIVAGTIFARWTGLLLIIGYLASGRGGIRLIARQLRPVGPVAKRVLAVGAPAGFDGLVMWFGHVLFLKIIGSLSTEAFAAHIAGIRVESFTYLSATAFGAAAATMIGQNLGASRAARARQAGHMAVIQGGLIGALIGGAFIAFPTSIMEFMNDDPAVRAAGTPALWLVGFFQVPLVMSIVYVAALRGAGQTRLPVYITLFGTYLIRLPFAYLFAVVLGWGLVGAWLGMCMDMLIRGLLAAGLYVFNEWEKTRI